MNDSAVAFYGVEIADVDAEIDKNNSAPMTKGLPGVLSLTYVTQEVSGQKLGSHSISASLKFPGVGPDHAFSKESGGVNQRSRDLLPGVGKVSRSLSCTKASYPFSRRVMQSMRDRTDENA